MPERRNNNCSELQVHTTKNPPENHHRSSELNQNNIVSPFFFLTSEQDPFPFPFPFFFVFMFIFCRPQESSKLASPTLIFPTTRPLKHPLLSPSNRAQARWKTTNGGTTISCELRWSRTPDLNRKRKTPFAPAKLQAEKTTPSPASPNCIKSGNSTVLQWV